MPNTAQIKICEKKEDYTCSEADYKTTAQSNCDQETCLPWRDTKVKNKSDITLDLSCHDPESIVQSEDVSTAAVAATIVVDQENACQNCHSRRSTGSNDTSTHAPKSNHSNSLVENSNGSNGFSNPESCGTIISNPIISSIIACSKNGSNNSTSCSPVTSKCSSVSPDIGKPGNIEVRCDTGCDAGYKQLEHRRSGGSRVRQTMPPPPMSPSASAATDRDEEMAGFVQRMKIQQEQNGVCDATTKTESCSHDSLVCKCG